MPGRIRTGRALVAGIALAVAAMAVAIAAPRNGGFETGDLRGWQTLEPGGGSWDVYSASPPRPASRGIIGPGDFPPPPRGNYAARVTQTGPGLNILHRKLRPRDNRINKLSFFLAYENHAERFYTPNSFDFRNGDVSREAERGAAVNRNQQLIIDLIKPKAKLKTLKPKNILARLYRTQRGDPQSRDYFKLRFNLNRLDIHRRFRLRIAEVDNQGELHVGVDAVKLVSKRPGG